jgi:ATP synthase I chain
VEADPSLRRVERTAVMVCLGMLVPAIALAGWPAALGVLGGGLLSAVSYRTIASSVSALTESLARTDASGGAPAERPGKAWILVKAASRYALLALLAYVMIARLRLPPLGVLAGASSVVAAVALEIAHVARAKAERPRPR